MVGTEKVDMNFPYAGRSLRPKPLESRGVAASSGPDSKDGERHGLHEFTRI